MKPCDRIIEEISASLDGRLDAASMEALVAHLAGCPSCRRAMQETETADALLRKQEPADLPVGLEDRIVAAARAARRTRKFLLAASPLAAAMLLVILGTWIGRRAHPQEPLPPELAEHLSVMAPFAEGVALISDEDPQKGLAFAREEARILQIRRRTEALKTLAPRIKANAEVSRHVQTTETFLTYLDAGDPVKLQEVARSYAYSLESVRLTAQPAKFTYGEPTNKAADVQLLVQGHLALASKDYEQAIPWLSAAAQREQAPSTASLWLAEAYGHSGKIDQALYHYATVWSEGSRESARSWSISYAARGIKDLAATSRRDIYLNNRIRVSSADETVLVGALAEESPAMYYAEPEHSGTWICVAPERSQVITTFARLKHRKGLQMKSERGLSTVRVDIPELVSSLNRRELEKLRSVDAIETMFAMTLEDSTPALRRESP
ncbi:MAG: zf-HC2 domain-containing protein [Planctomycetes bacterium]|nr:zf-HC2 domain-containing protein [Planctomycetota bacterium]